MRRAGLTLGVIAACLFSQVGENRKPPRWIADEMAAIERLAEGEPVSTSVDSRLRLADALKRLYPAETIRITRSALQILPQVRAMRVRSGYGLRAVELLAIAGDLEGAELALPLFARDSTEFSFALQQVTAYWMERGRQPAADFLSRALDAGYFDPIAVTMVLRYSVKEDPGEARLLFAKASALALARPLDRHVQSILTPAHEIAAIEPTAATDFAVRLLDVVTAESFKPAQEATAVFRVANRTVETAGTREVLLFQIAAFLRAWSPALYEQRRQSFARWDEAVRDVTAENVRRAAMPERFTIPQPARQPELLPYAPAGQLGLRVEELDERPVDVALSAARAGSDPAARAAALLNLLRTNFNIRGATWKAVADEALLELENGKARQRFGVMASLFDLALERRQASTAQRCGDTLLALIGQQSRCDEYECEAGDNPGIAVGTQYQAIVDRLSWHQQDAASLGLSSVSLEVRDRLSQFTRTLHRPTLSAR